ncbi:MAG TPA: hypothetical protein VNZ26_13770, partial [Vicinamibacterales bacterium]|nr:hypothetical protein [Vicinamibacterales bacterium]
MFAILVFTLKLSFPVLDVPALPAPPARDLLAQYDCTERLGLAVEAVRREGLERADAIFEDLLADCEGSPGLARELAGIRVAERRWHEATALARRAVEEDPNDQYACDLLGTTLLIQGEVIEALRAWNRIGKPVISDFGLVGSAMRVSATDLGVDAQRLLTPDRFRRARRRLDERAARTFARVEKFELQPNADGTMTVEVTIAQPSLVPRGWLNWAAVGGSAAVDREATIVFRSPTGPGEKCDTTWRWWTSRPRLAADCSLPSFTHGFWRLETFWEAETFEWTLGSSATHQPNSSSALLLRDVRAHGGLTSTDWLTSVWRYSIGLGFDAWAGRPAPDHADDLHTLE